MSSCVLLTNGCNFPRNQGSAAQCRQRGRLLVVAAVKKSSEKNVVCHKTLIAKADKVCLFHIALLGRNRMIYFMHMLHNNTFLGVHVLAGQAEKVAEMCKDILDFSHGKKSVKSNGIQEFAVSRDQFEPNVFYVWERYTSNADLGRHNSSTEFTAFMENVRRLDVYNMHIFL